MDRIKNILYVLFIFLPVCSLQAKTQPLRPTICLNMIVKNESEIITRCLTSLLPFIDYWVIVDTGSTDGTQQIIQNFFQDHGICGELHEKPWTNFGHNRNEAIQLAKGKGDYLLFIDADEYLVYDSTFQLPVLDKDYYYVSIMHSGLEYKRIQLVNNHLEWEYKGVLHEVIQPPSWGSFDILKQIFTYYTSDGARTKDPQKYQNDAQILEAAIKEEPDNRRYVFYLAQSYRDAREFSLALENYQKRVEMGGWDQEIFWSLLQIGRIEENLGMSPHIFTNSYLRAFRYRKSRIEPLYYLTLFFRKNKDYDSGYQTAKIAQSIPLSKDILFVEKWIYDYGLLLELSICAYWIGNFEECQQICLDLLKQNHLPTHIRTCIEKNLHLANAKLLENTYWNFSILYP